MYDLEINNFIFFIILLGLSLFALLIIFLLRTRASSSNRESFLSSIAILGERISNVGDLGAKSEKLLMDHLTSSFNKLDSNFKYHAKLMEEKIDTAKERLSADMAKNRDDLLNLNSKFNSSLSSNIVESSKVQYDQISFLTKTSLDSFEKTRSLLDTRLNKMQEIVDEKLQSTLEKRLGESFKLISERLEMLHKSFGEMQAITAGMSDLKRIMGNVKTRGVWGEIQLENILEEVLAPGQFDKNVKVKELGGERVDFAIKLPDKNGGQIFLPIDSKFPIEDYAKIKEDGDSKESVKQLETRIKLEAKSMNEKYINPPFTTDFAILFLPSEGLYYEVLRKRGLFEVLQNNYRVIIAGPWTLSAILNSLRLGFRTLAIERRSNEVWEVLDGVRLEFEKFGSLLEKTQKKLSEASIAIEGASKRTKKISQKLNNMQSISGESNER